MSNCKKMTSKAIARAEAASIVNDWLILMRHFLP